jgi:hypothetical protein
MSSDYFLICDKCKYGINIGQSGWPFSFYSGEKDFLDKFNNFIAEHVGCPLRVIIEDEFYDLEGDDLANPIWKEVEWQANNQLRS